MIDSCCKLFIKLINNNGIKTKHLVGSRIEVNPKLNSTGAIEANSSRNNVIYTALNGLSTQKDSYHFDFSNLKKIGRLEFHAHTVRKFRTLYSVTK